MPAAYIGLGSNLDNPIVQIKKAISALAKIEEIEVVQVSSLYQTQPWGPIQTQPKFINAVAELSTVLSPLELLECLLTIENQQGRDRTTERYGPRTLDLDILLYGVERFFHPELEIPHPKLAERDFVVYPLLEIAPDGYLPDGRSLSNLAVSLPSSDIEIIRG